MKLQNLTLSLLMLLFFNTAVQSENTDQQSSAMLKPIILTLAIPDKDKNSSEAIATAQEKILKQLQPFQIENITRYRYTPLLALSVDQAGLDMLHGSDDIISITEDGLSAPQTTRPEGTSQGNEKSPCNRNAK